MTSIILRRRRLGKKSIDGIVAAAESELKVVRNWVDADWPQNTPISYVFRWGCTSNIPSTPGEALKVINTAASIHWCSNKKQGRLDMQEAGVPVPKTWTAEEFERMIESGELDNDNAVYVSRPGSHAQGRNLSSNTANDITLWAGGYVSEFIDKEHEYRVFVCQNRAVWVAKKTPGNPEDVAWNVARGGRFDNVRWGDWPLQVVRAALQAAKVSGTDFCGVDVMVDHEGRPYVLEVNSAPSQTSPYRQQCVAKVFDYICENGRDHFPDVARLTSWKYAIHPGLRSYD